LKRRCGAAHAEKPPREFEQLVDSKKAFVDILWRAAQWQSQSKWRRKRAYIPSGADKLASVRERKRVFSRLNSVRGSQLPFIGTRFRPLNHHLTCPWRIRKSYGTPTYSSKSLTVAFVPALLFWRAHDFAPMHEGHFGCIGLAPEERLLRLRDFILP
jgi:hypothetical protein